MYHQLNFTDHQTPIIFIVKFIFVWYNSIIKIVIDVDI